jgi:hypothetical protein
MQKFRLAAAGPGGDVVKDAWWWPPAEAPAGLVEAVHVSEPAVGGEESGRVAGAGLPSDAPGGEQVREPRDCRVVQVTAADHVDAQDAARRGQGGQTIEQAGVLVLGEAARPALGGEHRRP